MRAYAIDRFGETGSVRELPSPEPKEGEVLVRVQAAGVNVVDAWVVAGALKDMMEHRFPLIPGVEASGVVEAAGAGVEGHAEGDEVYGVSVKSFWGDGTFAEFAILPVAGISRKPTSVGHLEAAALPHTALTALAVIDEADPREGGVVLLVGATGGVGSYVTQLAAQRGAHVAAVASGANADYARDLGAAETIDYGAGDLLELVRARHPDGVDAIIDLYSDGPTLTRLSQLVRNGGRVVSAAGAADAEVLAQRGLRGVNVNRPTERLPELTRLVDEGRIRVPRIRPYALDDAAEALAEIGGRHVRGKLVISLEPR